MSHATVRATILPEIIRLICVEQKVSEREALDLFYGSATGANFLYIYGLFTEEMQILQGNGTISHKAAIKKRNGNLKFTGRERGLYTKVILIKLIHKSDKRENGQ